MSNDTPKLNPISDLFQTLERPPEEANILANSPAHAIMRATGSEIICFMQPHADFDAMIEGFTMLDGYVRVIYNEQQVIMQLAKMRFKGKVEEAIDYFVQHRDDKMKVGEVDVPGPIFSTNIMDIHVPDSETIQ